jgi:putative ABC transport system permease protein
MSWPRLSWMGAVRTATGGMLRHKVQAVVLSMVLLVSTASATLGLALLAVNDGPFIRAFNAQHGADLSVTANPARAGAAQLAATRSRPGVTALAGPFGQAIVPTQWGGQDFGELTLVGRSAPGGPVDDAVLNAGHWLTGPGQVVLNTTPGDGGPVVGNTIIVTGLQHAVTLTVVGFASSITNTADGWVAPAEVSALRAPGAPASAQLLYRFASAGTAAQVRADLAEVTGALPPGTVTGSGSWLAAESRNTGNGAIMEPFVVAFALIGLAMAVLIVANVVSGAVAAGYYRIGVLKSVGLTPAQVVVVYLSRAGVPALAGCVLGVVAGNLLAVPVLHQSAEAYGVGSQSVPWWASVLAPAGMLILTVLAAFAPAVRAGRLSATQAIAAGRAPASGRGYGAYRLAARLRLPRPVSMGLAAPFARPARTLVSLAAIAFGATAVIFAFGLSASLGRAAGMQTLSATVPVEIQQNGPDGGPGQPPATAQAAAVDAALRAQPGTAHQTTVYENAVKMPGVAGNVNAWAFSGDASWIGYGVISGHWYDAPGQVDVNTAFLNASGLSVGGTATIDTGTAQVTVHIAGEVFRPSRDPAVFGSTQTLPGLGTVANLQQWDVGLRPGTSAAAYVQAVNSALGSSSPFAATTRKDGGKFYRVAIGLVGLLALMVAVAAGLGVLNTVLMTTRDRVHDLGIFKTLGMRPAQLLTMVVCWILGPAVVAAAIAAPVAVALNTATVHAMAGTAHTGIPASVTQVFPPSRLALLSLAALAIAVAGALAPASWAARARPAVALRTE